jgi:hypothetical protein
MRFFVALPLAIVMFPVQHPMYASVVVSHGLPNINGCPLIPLLGLIMRKLVEFSQESIEIAISFNVSIGLTTNLSTNCNIIEFGLKEVKPRVLQVSMVRILMATPKYTSVFGKKQP